MIQKYEVLHLMRQDDGAVRVETIARERAVKIFRPEEFMPACPAQLALLWALARAETIYLHRTNATVEYMIKVTHLKGERVI